MRSSGRHKRWGALALCAALSCLPFSVSALELQFPSTADLVTSTAPTDGRHPMATGPWTASGLPTTDATGVVQQFTWQITGTEITTESLLTTLQEQLQTQGYTIPFTCFASACGGFDFRHALPLGSAPEMFIDLGDFHYLSALSEDAETRAALTISRGGTTGFVHLALVAPPSAAVEVEAPIVQSTRNPDLSPDTPPSDLIARLNAMGSAPLDDLQFQTGASQLSGESYTSLTALAAFLAEDPSRVVVLVGHTDALGSLSGNIALSRARAINVQQFLITTLGVPTEQIQAHGIGYLAPRAPNTTPEGREANRRVEVVWVNSE